MTKGLEPWQSHVILVIERTTSVFSILGCLFVFITFICSKRFRRPVNRLIFFATWGNILLNVASLLAITPIADPDGPLCRFQGFLVQMFLVADAFWNLSIAINTYLIVFRKWNAKQLQRLELLYLAVNYGVTFIVAFVCVFINTRERGRVYGPATLWCSIALSWDGFRIYIVYGPAWVCMTLIFSIYISAWVHISRRKRALARTVFPTGTLGADKPEQRNQSPGTKTTEVMVTTTLSQVASPRPGLAPHMALQPSREGGEREDDAEGFIDEVFNPFRLDPNFGRGYDPYTVTVGTGEDPLQTKRRAAAAEANAAAWGYTKTALLYFASLLITWVPSSMNRVYALVHPEAVNFPFSATASVVLPLLGFWNGIIYAVTSWDAVVALWTELLEGCGFSGRVVFVGKPPRRGSRARGAAGGPGRGWFEIKGSNGNMPGSDAASEMQTRYHQDGCAGHEREYRKQSRSTHGSTPKLDLG